LSGHGIIPNKKACINYFPERGFIPHFLKRGIPSTPVLNLKFIQKVDIRDRNRQKQVLHQPGAGLFA